MRFLRDKRSNETNARCHGLTACISPLSRYRRFSYLPVLPASDLIPSDHLVSLASLWRPFSPPSLLRAPRVAVARGATWTGPRVVHRTLLRPLNK